MILIAGCGPSIAERELTQKVEAIKAKYRASDIEAELRPVYSQIQQGKSVDDFRFITTNIVPEDIRSFPIFAYVSNECSYGIVGSEDTKEWGLEVHHEGGPEYEGIIYCPFDGGESVARSIHGGNAIIIPWTNGIYFYDFTL
jgi:hypothetical protein